MSERGTDIFDKVHEYGIDLKRRRIFMQTPFWPSWQGKRLIKRGREEDMSFGWSDMIVRNLLWMDTTKGPIELWLHTPGGSMQEMWAIYDVIQTANNPIITICFGEVASAGCLILASGTGTRYAMPHSSFMWHGGWESADLSPREFEDRATYYKQERLMWVDRMAKHTSPRDEHTQRKLKTHKAKSSFWEERTHDRELWFPPSKMVANGVVDEIWEGE